MLETIFCIHSWGCLVEDGFMLIACCFRMKGIPSLLKSQRVNIHTFVHIPMKDLFLSSLQIKNVHLRISSNFPNFYIQISIYLGIFSYIFIFSYCLSWFFSHEHIFLFTFHPDHLNFLGLPHNQRLKLVNGLKLYLSLSQIRKVSKLSAISERWKWSFPNLS